MITMWEILMLGLVILMAKRKGKGRGRFRRYLKGAVYVETALGTLAAKDVVSGNHGDVLTEKAWLSSVVLTWSQRNMTPTTGAGPVQVGIAHSDYTDAEIEEWIENLGSWEEGGMVEQEKARRKIRLVGAFKVGTVATEIQELNDGKAIRTKCGWMLTTGQTLRVWYYNSGSQALATTDPAIVTEGHANLWPA